MKTWILSAIIESIHYLRLATNRDGQTERERDYITNYCRIRSILNKEYMLAIQFDDQGGFEIYKKDENSHH